MTDILMETRARAHALDIKDTDSAAVWKPDASVSESPSLPPDAPRWQLNQSVVAERQLTHEDCEMISAIQRSISKQPTGKRRRLDLSRSLLACMIVLIRGSKSHRDSIVCVHLVMSQWPELLSQRAGSQSQSRKCFSYQAPCAGSSPPVKRPTPSLLLLLHFKPSTFIMFNLTNATVTVLAKLMP